MAKPPRSYFDSLTRLVRTVLETIALNRLDFNPDRVLWEIHGSKGEYQIRLKEIHTLAGRLYSYYLIRHNDVVVGFDNYPDRQVLRQKYGDDFQQHLFEQTPHKHGLRKTTLELTEDMSVEAFLAFIIDDHLNLK